MVDAYICSYVTHVSCITHFNQAIQLYPQIRIKKKTKVDIVVV